MSTWTTLLTFTDYARRPDDPPAPLVYADPHRVPRVDDPRGGQLDVAALAAHVLPVLDEQTGLRFAVYDVETGRSAACVLDRDQVALLNGVLQGWLDGRGGEFVAGLGERISEVATTGG